MPTDEAGNPQFFLRVTGVAIFRPTDALASRRAPAHGLTTLEMSRDCAGLD
jgi:hypothetical protein